MKHYIIKDHFFQEAKDLRKTFEKNFSVRKDISPNRFVWDYWYVENQYKLLRTPAYQYFPENLYYKFHKRLVQWGREVLGCHDVSPPWMSYYIDGFGQNFHSDVPHGPWAFVFSLTPKVRKFKGGETVILRPQVLNYWQNFLVEKDREENAFLEKIQPNFNRLVVFDPRFPHGVSEVRGTQDPLESRLVIHGWFVEPRPYVVGPLSTTQVQKVIEPAIYSLGESMAHVGSVHGTASVRLQVNRFGAVEKVIWLTNTMIGLENHNLQIKHLTKLITQLFLNLKFAKSSRESLITIPLIFK